MSWSALSRGVGVVLLGWIASGCVHVIAEEQSSVGNKTRDCVVPLPAGVSALGSPTSLEYPDSSLFIWGSVTLSDSSQLSNPSAVVSSSAELCKSGPVLSADASGAPQTLLALSAAETKDNAARTDGRQLALSPHGGVVSEGVGYLYYEHTLLGPGVFDAEILGTGLCILSAPDQPCTRLEVNGSSVLWPPGAWPKNQGGLVYEGRALLLGCRRVASFEQPCVISGVPLDQIQDPAAYEYFNAFDGWVEDPGSASVVFDLQGTTTLVPIDGRYAATNFDIFQPSFSLRFAPAPTGDFGRALALFDGISQVGPFTQGGSEHHALSTAARGLTFSYFVDRPGAEYGLHLVDFELNGGLQ